MKISNSVLKKLSFMYIFLPCIVFFIGFLKLYIALPTTIALVCILYRFMKSSNSSEVFYVSKKCFFLIVSVALIWCLFGGIGKLFYQPTYFLDHVVRNTIYKDLIVNPWPVHYDKGIYLCYYIGQWLVPALFGKIALFITNSETFAYLFGNIILYIWCTIGIILVFLWLVKIVKATNMKKVISLLIMFIFFSGLDVLGDILNGNFKFENLLNGFEWWANFDWQYSSFTSLIFWVFNQAIVAMLITLMLYDQDDYENRGVVLIFGLLFAPYPMLGLGIYLLAKDIATSIKQKSISLFKKYFSLQNILSVVFIFPILFLFFYANYKIAFGDTLYDENLELFYINTLNIKTYLLFVFIEFLTYVILIYNHKVENKIELFVITIALLIIPLLGIYDFVMRTSIPFLIILFLNIYKFIFDKTSNKYRKYILCILLSIAALNPLAEFNRGIYETYKQGFIGSTAGEFDIMSLSDYYKHNYTSHEDSFFFNVLAKEVKTYEEDNTK